MKSFRSIFPIVLFILTAAASAADPVPTLNEILNASQLDVRSLADLPKPAVAQVVEILADAPIRQARGSSCAPSTRANWY